MTTQIYTSKLCAHCVSLKSFLKSFSIPFLEVDISENIKARDEIVSKGFRKVPVLQVGDEFVAGTELEEVKRLLHI